MKYTYVLIIVARGNSGLALDKLFFDDEEACLDARNQVRRNYLLEDSYYIETTSLVRSERL